MKKYPVIIIVLVSSLLMLMGMTGITRAGDNTACPESIKSRLQRLEDRESIHDLLIRYGRLLDKEDFVGYSELFAQDGVWEGGIGSAKGPEGIHDMLEKVFGRMERGQYGNSYHVMSDIMINVNGDTATSRSNWTWIVEGEKGKPVIQRSGHYEDTLIRENGHWKFKYRLTVTSLPAARNDSESHLFRRDHREYGSDSN